MKNEEKEQNATDVSVRNKVMLVDDFECDCDDDCDFKYLNDWYCEKCEKPVKACSECNMIIEGCDCGHCEEGETIQESDY